MINMFFWCIALFMLWFIFIKPEAKKAPDETKNAEGRSVTEAEIRAFFANPENFAETSIEHIFSALGKPAEHDDWDWGRLVYEWERPTLRLRVITRGSTVICVDELDPKDNSRFGTVLVNIWGDSSP